MHTYGIQYIHPDHGLQLAFETGINAIAAENKFKRNHKNVKFIRSFLSA